MGLLAFGALIAFLIIAIEPEEYGTGRGYSRTAYPDHLSRKTTERKKGKKIYTTKTSYKPISN